MSEYISGNIFIRAHETPMKKGDKVIGHRHNFDHTTYINRGTMKITLLNATEIDPLGNPLEASIDKEMVVDSTDTTNWALILKGRFHILEALKDDTVYHCIYSHQMPQALDIESPGGLKDYPLEKRDESGNLWVRVNEKIVQSTSEWSEAYK